MKICSSMFAVVAIAILATTSHADITIIGGTVGNGDFEASEPATGPIQYIDTPSWFNASGSEGINFTNDSQTGGSSQPGSRAGMPFMNRVQVNSSSYTVAAAGQTFSLSYDFGAGGGPAAWNGPTDEMMRTFLFTSAMPVDGFLTTADINELATDLYGIDRANDGQWTSYAAPSLYTTTAADVGSTIYFGMEFLNASGNDLFPRLDVVNLTVTEPAAIPEPAAFGILTIAAAGMLRRKRS